MSTMTTGMPMMTKPQPQPSSFPQTPGLHCRLSTLSELWHFRWNISKASFIVFHPQPTPFLTFSLLAHGIPFYPGNHARNMRTIFKFSISLPSHIQSETKSCQLYSYHSQIYLFLPVPMAAASSFVRLFKVF